MLCTSICISSRCRVASSSCFVLFVLAFLCCALCILVVLCIMFFFVFISLCLFVSICFASFSYTHSIQFFSYSSSSSLSSFFVIIPYYTLHHHMYIGKLVRRVDHFYRFYYCYHYDVFSSFLLG